MHHDAAGGLRAVSFQPAQAQLDCRMRLAIQVELGAQRIERVGAGREFF
jgi:hypothetical protein